MDLALGKVNHGDCIKGMQGMPEASVDLVFADPPFNIGYEYDAYDDRQDHDTYLERSRQWIQEVHRVLKPEGTFWLAIGDEYAAELKLIAQNEYPGRPIRSEADDKNRAEKTRRRRPARRARAKVNECQGFTCRSWVIWYYTFGVNCKRKFTRSHTHLFHFVKDAKNFTFNAADIRVRSARQLVYNDKRQNPSGRLPDDTWILRPQDVPQCFTPNEDTCYFSRVCGTFGERQGWHGCQMPERLLERIIRVSSNRGDVVLDPFVGSGTTLVVAKKLGRRFLGFEISEDYARSAERRLALAHQGDPLTGPENPLTSARRTGDSRGLGQF